MSTENIGIYAAMAKASKAISAIEKISQNKQQGFMYRSIDSIYNGIHSALADNDIICLPRILRTIKEREITTQKGGTGFHMILEIEYTFCYSDSSSISAIVWGEAVDYGDKTVNKCMSIAHKYALMQIFTIPTENSIDPDDVTPEIEQRTSITMDIKKELNLLLSTTPQAWYEKIGKTREYMLEKVASESDIVKLKSMLSFLQKG